MAYNESKHAYLLQEGNLQTLGHTEARKLADAKKGMGVGHYTVERYKAFIIKEGVDPTFFPDKDPKESTSKSKLSKESPLIIFHVEKLFDRFGSKEVKTPSVLPIKEKTRSASDQDGIDDGSLEQKELLERSPRVRNSKIQSEAVREV